MWNVNGQEENKVGIGNTPQIRFKDLKEGEVVVGNPLTRSFIKFKENGDVQIDVQGSVDVNVTGDYNVNVDGDTTWTTNRFTIDEGELRVQNDIRAFYDSGAPIVLSNVRITYNLHTHDETGTVTEEPNEQLPT